MFDQVVVFCFSQVQGETQIFQSKYYFQALRTSGNAMFSHVDKESLCLIFSGKNVAYSPNRKSSQH